MSKSKNGRSPEISGETKMKSAKETRRAGKEVYRTGTISEIGESIVAGAVVVVAAAGVEAVRVSAAASSPHLGRGHRARDLSDKTGNSAAESEHGQETVLCSVGFLSPLNLWPVEKLVTVHLSLKPLYYVFDRQLVLVRPLGDL
jgi:hypothetical protein